MENNQENKEERIIESKPAGYKVESLILVESNFTRSIGLGERVILEVQNKVHIEPFFHETTEDGKFAVSLRLLFEGHNNIEEPLCHATIRMTAVFEKYGEPPLSEDKFKTINAPAIIYPFIREHLHSLCLKAGIANVLLPTINFKP